MTDTIFKDAIALRKHLHQYPEVSCYEKEASEYLFEKLKECTPDELIRFQNFGLAAIYEGETEGKTLLIRGDFDALPIEEINDIEYKSVHVGVGHMCGHDGHAAILYGLARYLKDHPPKSGKTILLFQPAEENGEGARGIMNDPAFIKLQPDMAVALHNLPGYPLHTVICKEGAFTAAANSMIIKLKGKTSHAAEPELGINPARAMAKITEQFLSLNQADLKSDEFRIATPIYMAMGEKSYGVSAGYGELHFTLRAWDNQVMKEFENKCEEIARETADQDQLQVEISWTQHFFANQNDKHLTEAIKRVASKNKLEVQERNTPFKWGEDFGLFTEALTGAMFGLGSGEDCPALHNPDYDFPDDLIETGVLMFSGLVSELQ